MKDVAEAESVLATSASPDPKGADPETDSLHHRKRGMRTLQFLRDAEHLTVFLVSSLLLYLPEANARAARRMFFTRS
jgi:hypothetical protein